MATRTTHSVHEPRRIRVLASPLRQDIVDFLESGGPASIAEVASCLGRRPDALYYHFRRLLAVDLIHEVGLQGEGRSMESVFDVVGRPLKIEYRPHSPQNIAAIQKLSSSMLRSADRGFRRAFARDDVETDGPARNIWTGRLMARLTPPERGQLNRLLEDIKDIFVGAGGRRSGVLQTITFSLSPLDDTGANDS